MKVVPLAYGTGFAKERFPLLQLIPILSTLSSQSSDYNLLSMSSYAVIDFRQLDFLTQTCK